MASKFTCVCGNVIRTNLYEGHGLHLLVAEESTDIPEHLSGELYKQHIDKMVREAPVIARCSNCGVLATIDNDGSIKLYAPVTP